MWLWIYLLNILMIYEAQEIYIVHSPVFENDVVHGPVQMEASDNKMS